MTRRTRRNAVVLSAGIHLLALLVLWFSSLEEPTNATGIQLVSSRVQQETLEFQTFSVQTPEPPLELEPTTSRLAEPVEMFSEPIQIQPPRVTLQSQDGPLTTATQSKSSVASGGNPGPTDAAGGAAFFGHPLSEARIAFVLDGSHSMTARLPRGGQAETRKQRLMRELRNALSELPEETHFVIVMFKSDHAFELRGGLQPANDRNIRRAVSWVNNFRWGGGSDPVPALDRVLRVTPPMGAVYLLSDGKLQEGAVDKVRGLNLHRVPIYTIGLGSLGDDDAVLRQLASATGGSYRAVHR